MVNVPEPADPREIVPSVVAGLVLVFVSVTVPVGAGVDCVVPATVAVKVTVWPVVVVDGEILKVVADGANTGEILPK